MDAKDEPTSAVTVVLTGAEARSLWSFTGMLRDDPGALRAAWTWDSDPEARQQMERELDDDPDWTQATISAAGSGFRKLFDVLSERLGPDVQLGPRRLTDSSKKGGKS